VSKRFVIDKTIPLTRQILNDQKIQQLDQLRSQLYLDLGSPFQPLTQGTESYNWGGYIIWQEDKQAELIGYQNWTISLDYQIRIYTQTIDKLSNGVIQLKLNIDNVIYIEEYKKRKRNKKKVVELFNYIQLKLMLGG
jgi:hypothetical protein